jgi:hypothetical protein
LGIISGVATGTFFFAYPNGQGFTTTMGVYCAIYSTISKKCIYRSKEISTAYNSSLQKQLHSIFKKTFDRIKPFFVDRGNLAGMERSPVKRR